MQEFKYPKYLYLINFNRIIIDGITYDRIRIDLDLEYEGKIYPSTIIIEFNDSIYEDGIVIYIDYPDHSSFNDEIQMDNETFEIQTFEMIRKIIDIDNNIDLERIINKAMFMISNRHLIIDKIKSIKPEQK